MGVTLGQAAVGDTYIYTYATLDTTDPRSLHITGFQATMRSVTPGANCLVLPIPGNKLRLMDGPERTHTFIADMCRDLPSLIGGGQAPRVSSPQPQASNNHQVVLAEHASGILDALGRVHPDCRPFDSQTLRRKVAWLQTTFPDYGFVLVCFNGLVDLGYPFVVGYVPLNDDMLCVPCVDSYTDDLPIIGGTVSRDCRVAFAVEGTAQPFTIVYSDDSVAGQPWTPNDVTGFYDTRPEARNVDHWLSLVDAANGYAGQELLEVLV